MAVEIPLTRGVIAIVDDEDADLAELKWCTSSTGYAKRIGPRPARKTIFLHQVIGDRIGCPGPGLVRDHINGDTLDNRRPNLRWVSQSVNMHNRRIPKNNKSGVLGVSFNRTTAKWRACICHQGKQTNIGQYKTFEEAAEARLRVERELWGIEPRRAEAHAR